MSNGDVNPPVLQRDSCRYPTEAEIDALCTDDDIKAIVDVVSNITPSELCESSVIDFEVVLGMIRRKYEEFYGADPYKTYAMNFLLANCRQA